MIKFFRNIRKKLVSEKPSTTRTANYLKYAIGEIVLVVIGILIALSINNWNEERKNSIEEFKILLSLKNEFVNNQEEIKDKIIFHQFVLLKADELSKLMNPNPKVIELEKLDTLMFAIAYLVEYHPITTIMNSEKLELIKDDKLKKMIASWSYSFDKYKYSAKVIYDLYYNSIYPFISMNYQMKNIKGEIDMKDKSYFDVDIVSILSNSSFENHVTMKRINAQILLEHAMSLFDLQKKILHLIEFKLSNEK